MPTECHSLGSSQLSLVSVETQDQRLLTTPSITQHYYDTRYINCFCKSVNAYKIISISVKTAITDNKFKICHNFKLCNILWFAKSSTRVYLKKTNADHTQKMCPENGYCHKTENLLFLLIEPETNDHNNGKDQNRCCDH